jgi:DNA polymerase-3 subunit chi
MEISFYHLAVTPMEKAVPALLERAYDAGMRSHLLCDATQKKDFDSALWTYHPRKFLPHGTDDDAKIAPERQPVLISAEQENLNKAKVLAVTNGTQIEDFGKFKRVLDIFDGNVEKDLAAARKRWKAYKDAGHEMRYWSQDEKGKWVEKA